LNDQLFFQVYCQQKRKVHTNPDSKRGLPFRELKKTKKMDQISVLMVKCAMGFKFQLSLREPNKNKKHGLRDKNRGREGSFHFQGPQKMG